MSPDAIAFHIISILIALLAASLATSLGAPLLAAWAACYLAQVLNRLYIGALSHYLDSMEERHDH